MENKNNFPMLDSRGSLKPENHKTAAWADIQSTEPESQVPFPSERAVIEAKEWVDENEK